MEAIITDFRSEIKKNDHQDIQPAQTSHSSCVADGDDIFTNFQVGCQRQEIARQADVSALSNTFSVKRMFAALFPDFKKIESFFPLMKLIIP